jgi:hypothetical protein
MVAWNAQTLFRKQAVDTQKTLHYSSVYYTLTNDHTQTRGSE